MGQRWQKNLDKYIFGEKIALPSYGNVKIIWTLGRNFDTKAGRRLHYNQDSFPLGLCLTPSGTRTSAFALSVQPYQQSLAAGLSASAGGGNSMRGHQRAADPSIPVIQTCSHRRKGLQHPVPALKQAELGFQFKHSSFSVAFRSRSADAAPPSFF